MNKTIGDIAESVFVGLSMHGRSIALSDEQVKDHEERGAVIHTLPYLTPSAIRGDRLCFDHLDTVSFSSPHFQRYSVQPGDVLVVSRSTHFRSIVVPKHASQCVIASSFIAVRINPSILSPELLCAYLNDSTVVESMVRTSNSALSISVKNIEGVRLRLPEQVVLDRLYELYDTAMSHHRLSIEIADALLTQARLLVTSHLEVSNE